MMALRWPAGLNRRARHHTHPDVKQVAIIKALADFLYEKLSASDKVTRTKRKIGVILMR